ncbi:MAG: HD-GYP domain-containing protein [Gemmatimonadaceae bacterium]
MQPAFLAAVVLAVAWARERDARRAAERFGAAAFESILFAIDANDADTGRHVRRVAASAVVLAECAGLDAAARREVERVALFHDIGKIAAALFDIVHDGAHELSDADRRAIGSHPQRGAEVLAPLIPFYPVLGEGVLSHHERWDGTGYPRRLAGEAIPLPARIVSIADSFDAITHVRRYSSGESHETALAAILQGRGTQFDPVLVDLFVSPRVQRRIARAQREIGHGAARPERRESRVEPHAPDVTFRWRKLGAVGAAERSLRPGLAPRRSRGRRRPQPEERPPARPGCPGR